MPARRPVLFFLLLALAAPGAQSLRADPAQQVLLLQRTRDGRDSVRALGPGKEVRFVTDGRGPVHVRVFDPDSAESWIVTLEEPAGAGSFAERVRARRAIVDAFQNDLPRRLPPRAGVAGRGTPRFLRTFDRLLAGGVARLTVEEAARLRASPGVRSVTPDHAVTTQLWNSVPQVRGDRVRRDLGVTGLGVRVGILDTGIDYMHPALGSGFGPGTRVEAGWDFVNLDADPMDDHGHGTHVAGIVGGNGGGITGMAPHVTFASYKVLDENGSGVVSNMILALERCADPDQDPGTDDALDVVNMSLGSFPQGGQDPATDAVDALDALGTLVVVAAGNMAGRFLVASPGTARGAITVGSVNGQDLLSAFSSRGPTIDLRIKPDVVAPGEWITSAAAGGGTTAKSGTSMAAPHVAGAAALLLQLHPEWTHSEHRAAIIGGAVDLGLISSDQGTGRLDAWAMATSRLFVSPTSVSFGRVPPDGSAWADAETLHVRSHESGPVTVDLAIVAGTPPPGVSWSIEPERIVVPPGGEEIAILRMVRVAGIQPPWADPLYVAEGVVQVRTANEVRRVPFSAHEFLRLDLTFRGYGPTSTLFGSGRAWPSQLPFGSTFLLRPGTYDALCFNDFFEPATPFLGMTGITVVRDTVVAMDGAPLDGSLALELEDHRGHAIQPPTMTLMLLHESGGGVGILRGRPQPLLRLPRMTDEYKLEWVAGGGDSLERYDIPGTVAGPFATQRIANDRFALRRLVEHVAVATTDSVIAIDFPLQPEGENGYWGFGFYNPFETPRGTSFDIVRWTAPTPYRPHARFGHTTWTIHPARARAFDSNPYSGVGAIWEQDRGDTLVVLRNFELGPPKGRFTGRDLPFGSGPLSFRGRIEATATTVTILPSDFYTSRWFRDASGACAAGPPVEVELSHAGNVFYSGPAEGEDRVLQWSSWQRSLPSSASPVEVKLLSRGGTVAGQPSVTRVSAAGPPGGFEADGFEWFAIVADGGPAERIAFGQSRDPHVEMRLAPSLENSIVGVDYRHGPNGAWVPIGIQREGTFVRANLVPAYGDISLRVRVEGTVGAYAPLVMEIAPAFRGERPVSANAKVLEARGDAHGAHLTWEVGVPGAPLIVERFETGAGWQERAELIVEDDGIARFDDANVVAGATYGYRLAGSTAEVFVRIPGAEVALALSVAPNPSPGQVFATVSVDDDRPLSLALIDIQGRVVESRTVAGLTPGVHLVPLAARGRLPAGLYFVRLKRDGDTRVARVTVLE